MDDGFASQQSKQACSSATFAGTRGVLTELKRYLDIGSDEPPQSATCIEPDRYYLRDDSPLRAEHQILSQYLQETGRTAGYHTRKLVEFPTGRQILAMPADAVGRILLAAAERHVGTVLVAASVDSEHLVINSRYVVHSLPWQLLELPISLSRDGLFDLLLYLSVGRVHHIDDDQLTQLISQIEQLAANKPLDAGERNVLARFRDSHILEPLLGDSPEELTRLTRLVGDGARYFLIPGEVWSNTLNGDLATLAPELQRRWQELLEHLLTATVARPSAKWLKTVTKLAETIGFEDLQAMLRRWLPLVSQGQTSKRLGGYHGDARGMADVIREQNALCLRGLLWMIQVLPGGDQLHREVTALALSAYKKVPGVGPRAVKVGNAAVYALAEMATIEVVGQLAMLKVRVKFGTAQLEIEKAFNRAAAALDLPRDQIEEMGIPSYGLEEVGVRREALGDYGAELTVTGTDAELHWFDAHGKQLKSVPAKVKSEHREDWKELQQSLKDIQAMLPAQRDRIDSMFLLQRSWPIETWRTRYLMHPLVGTIVRRLLWCIDGAGALFVDEKPTDAHGNPIAVGPNAEVSLWHPVGRTIEEISAWRRRLEALEITQPFKQAHRELYLLTDAERHTHTYSNRFAAHVLRQHQFNALCAARGWKNKLRLMVDADYAPPSKELPQWGLRAEFWVEGIGDDYGRDANQSGVYLRLASDQVRFYRLGAAENLAHAGGGGYSTNAPGPGEGAINEPLPLAEIPALVFSEIMRDVDLFVGVASVGNDPTWQDGGPEGRYRDYWQRYSFGELSGTATTRKAVLEQLVPRLKIADQCSFSDRFLVVRGHKRTYKIHLGSGNILMEPNDQYLCIVPDARSRAQQQDLFLPFEGDGTLSIIISKALLLADDFKIKDPTITRQIAH